MDGSDALNIVLATALIIMGLLNRKQIDLEQVNQLIDRLAPKVAETQTQVDDIALQFAKTLSNSLSQAGSPIKGDEGGDSFGEFNEERGT